MTLHQVCLALHRSGLDAVMVLLMETGASFWDEFVFAGLDDVDVEAVASVFGTVEVLARGRADEAACPDCGRVSGRVHGSYQRRLNCRRRTFAESLPELTAPDARFTTRLNRLLERVGVALAGRSAPGWPLKWASVPDA